MGRIMQKLSRSAAFVLVPLAIVLIGAAVLVLGRQEARPERSDRAAFVPAAVRADSSLRKATFAGGCFWCIESALQDLEGVKTAVSGFSGGTTPNPTYREVSSGETDYVESVQVYYDPDEITYRQLLTVYWHYIDPTDAGGQFADRGPQYRPVIFYHNERQQRLARQSKQELAQTGPFEEPIVVTIEPFTGFYAAKEYHQDYYLKHPERYARYYEGSGRGPFLERVWGSAHPQPLADEVAVAPEKGAFTVGGVQVDVPQGPSTQEEVMQAASVSIPDTGPGEKVPPNGGAPDPWRSFEMPSEEELRARLTELQYRVTQEAATEPAFRNPYYDNKRPGIYVDIVSGEPLFSSKTKFHSGTGWPSFYKPLEPELVVEEKDYSLGLVRTEVLSRYAGSHLGHVFEWPVTEENPTGLRYCLNSAALRFIPADQLEEAGYGEYAHLFE